MVTLLDLRTEIHLNVTQPAAKIKSPCITQFRLLDDLQRPEIRDLIPRQGMVITVTETGNRDRYVIHYLSQFGFDNIKGLLIGMRGWIKAGYPIQKN